MNKEFKKLLIYSAILFSIILIIYPKGSINPTGDVIDEPQLVGVTPEVLLDTPPVVNYSIEEINNQVVSDADLYFEFKKENYSVKYDKYMYWLESYYTEYDKTLYLGISGIENNPEKYKLLFAHEYSHYVLHRLGLENGYLHEALAETFTWFEEKEGQKEVWGKLNENREYPYDIIMDKIVTHYDCLYGVFNKEKISKISDYLNKLENECSISLEEIINDI